MLDLIIGGIRCKVSLLFPAVLLLLLLIDHTGIAAFGFLAAILHECGHMFVMILYGQSPRSLTISFYGMRMEVRPSSLSVLQESVLYLGGPCINIFFAFISSVCGVAPFYSHIHLVLAFLNLLPILPLDGGQLICVVLSKYMSADRVAFVMNILFGICFLPLIVLGVLVFVYNRNFTLLLFCGYLGAIKVFYKGN